MSCAPSSLALLFAALPLAAVATPDCAPPPPLGAGEIAELLLLVDLGPGTEETLQSVLYTGDGHFWLDAVTLSGWRVPLPESGGREYAGQRWHSIDQLPGLAYRYDACRQALALDLARVDRPALRYSMRSEPPPEAPAAAAPGAFGNLDLQLSRERGEDTIATLGEIGLFGPAGRGTQTLVLGDGRRLRLDSTWYRESPQTLTSFALGDSISNGGTWGRPLRYGGVRWATDFSLQPYFVTFPQPLLRGQAELPSTAEVFVNDTLRARRDVDGGAFELQDVPTLTGGGEAQIIVRDVLGRETRVVQPFYVSPALLRAGLSDFAVDAGWQREAYGLRSAEYGAGFVSALHRRGLDDTRTREVRLEAARDGVAGGASLLWLVGSMGLLSGTAAWGAGGDAGGPLLGLGFERDLAGRYGFALRTQWADDGFWQLGLAPGQRVPRQSDFARMSVVAGARSTFAVAYVGEDRRGEPDLRLSTFSWSRRLAAHWQLDLSATHAVAGERSRSVLLAIGYTPGTRFNAGAQYDWHNRNGGNARIGVQRTAVGPLDWSGRVELQDGSHQRQELSGQWGLPRAQLSATAVSDDLGTHSRLGARSGIVFLDRTGYLTRPVQGSFALVRAAGVADVDVYADNRVVARTGRDGSALVPELRPYQRNRLSLRAEDVPVERALDSLSRNVTPPQRSGVVVSFGEDDSVAMEYVLRDAQGRLLPAGAEVRELATGEAFPVGTEGRVFVRQHAGVHHLWVQAPGWDCIARVELRAPLPETPPVALCEAKR